MNKVILIGNIVKDIELRQTQAGTSVVVNTIAVRRNFKNQTGEYESDFINFVAYRTTAELLVQYFTKGDKIGLTGRWQNRSYKNQNDQTVYVSELIVEDIEFLQTKKAEEKSEEKVDPSQDISTAFGIGNEDLPF